MPHEDSTPLPRSRESSGKMSALLSSNSMGSLRIDSSDYKTSCAPVCAFSLISWLVMVQSKHDIGLHQKKAEFLSY